MAEHIAFIPLSTKQTNAIKRCIWSSRILRAMECDKVLVSVYMCICVCVRLYISSVCIMDKTDTPGKSTQVVQKILSLTQKESESQKYPGNINP